MKLPTSILGCSLMVALVSGALWLCQECFAYSLMTITGKDVPWYLDLAGGILLNAVNLPLAGICFILNFAGVPSPWIG